MSSQDGPPPHAAWSHAGPGEAPSCHTSQTAPCLGDSTGWMKLRLPEDEGQRAPTRLGSSSYLGAPGWTADDHHLKEPSSPHLREPDSQTLAVEARGRGLGRVSPGLTAALQCTVVEWSPRVRSVAPGPMAIPVRVPAEVLLQLSVWGGGGREPRQEREQNHRVIPRPRRAPVGQGAGVSRKRGLARPRTHSDLCGFSADQRWHGMPLRVLLTEPRYFSPAPW